jgi:type IV secretory pathway VirB3-like protein
MRTTYNCVPVNAPKAIAGLEWKLVVGVCVFFGMAALMYRSPGVLMLPAVFLIFLRGPARKDSMFIRIYLRHRVQRQLYSPAYITAKNQTYVRPVGFNRLQII